MKRQNKTLLVAEDDVNDQLFIQRAWKKISPDAHLQLVENGLEAIAYLDGIGKYSDRQKFEFPTMILTDLKMPFADGFEVIKYLRNNPEWGVIPTIIFSASSDTNDIKTAYRVGANAYLIKPSNPKDLESMLQALHDFWVRVEVPQINQGGDMKVTDSEGKLG